MALYVPGLQAIQGPMFAPAYPTLHEQFPPPSPENVFAGQLVQFDADADEYLPASHGTQDMPPLTFEYVPASQRVQAVGDETLEAVPTSHAGQLKDPVRLEYLPAPHGLHSCALRTSL